MSSSPSKLDWSEMCDVALSVRQRLSEGGHKGLLLNDHELTVLICAALEYSNRLAHEAGNRHSPQRQGD